MEKIFILCWAASFLLTCLLGFWALRSNKKKDKAIESKNELIAIQEGVIKSNKKKYNDRFKTIPVVGYTFDCKQFMYHNNKNLSFNYVRVTKKEDILGMEINSYVLLRGYHEFDLVDELNLRVMLSKKRTAVRDNIEVPLALPLRSELVKKSFFQSLVNKFKLWK